MRLLVVAGFLGSGKTTLLLQIARGLTAASQTVAIVENEVGEVGVDGAYLSKQGMHVQELFGGCICCTLSVGLVETLNKVERLYQPDWTIVEPTGVARPGDLITSLRTHGPQIRPQITDLRGITVVDASRYDMLAAIMSPMLTEQVKTADLLVVNKIDEVDGRELDRICSGLREISRQVKLITLCAEEPESVRPLMEWLR